LEQLYSPVPSFTLFAYSALVSFFGFTFPPPLASKKERKKGAFIFNIGPHLQIIKKVQKRLMYIHERGKGAKEQCQMKQWCAQARKVWCQGYGAKMWHNRF